jgi:hypothetical protein
MPDRVPGLQGSPKDGDRTRRGGNAQRRRRLRRAQVRSPSDRLLDGAKDVRHRRPPRAIHPCATCLEERPVSGLARVAIHRATPSHGPLAAVALISPCLAYRCGGSAGIVARGHSPTSRFTCFGGSDTGTSPTPQTLPTSTPCVNHAPQTLRGSRAAGQRRAPGSLASPFGSSSGVSVAAGLRHVRAL